MICKQCQHRRCREEEKKGGHAVIWGCVLKRIRFGYQFEYDAGKNMPESCINFSGSDILKTVAG